MGVPIVEAPCEAEVSALTKSRVGLTESVCKQATCAALARADVVYGAGTEDMDTLTLGVRVSIYLCVM
jgi:tRNA U54 and U55 pseudouridine synthase Pus10